MKTTLVTRRVIRLGLIAAALQLAPAAVLHAQDVPVELKRRIEQLRSAGSLRLAGEAVELSNALAAVYERSGFAPVWQDARARDGLVRAIHAAAADGLTPAHYHLAVLESAAAAPQIGGAAIEAELDVLRTHALLRLAADLRFGRLRAAAAPDALDADAVRRAAAEDRVGAALDGVRSTHFVYTGLARALAELRGVQETGGWGVLAGGPVLRVGDSSARVPALRQRLVLGGDLAADPAVAASPLFDSALDAGVKRFQHRHGLNEDGVVGARTLAELNVPVAARIEQVRINLERARWVTHDLADTFVAVNIAGARVYLVRDGDVVFETRAIVGTAATATPVFSATMRYIDINPTWTVPPGIVGEVLAAIRRNPGHLRQQNMRVIDASGRVVSADRDFGAYTARTFPYVFRQEPGPLNPLGQIKFVFPNRHNVYLHDTPGRALFEREERLFSHGCIRVSEPLRLAELLLDDPAWTRAALDAAVAAGTTRTVNLRRPVPVVVQYWTASTDLHGELHFYRDVYDRDAAVLRGLR
jgi:L,D-transpeptidase YcbB